MAAVLNGEAAYLLALLDTREETGLTLTDIRDQLLMSDSAEQVWDAHRPDDLFDAGDGALAAADARLTAWAAAGHRALACTDPAFPDQLSSIHEMPLLIWTHGRLLTRDLGVCVVGTRKPSPRARAFVTDLVSHLADAGRTIVSGLARGIDTHAHQRALELGARTVAVIGTGIDRTYPAENADLADAITHEGGLVLSQFAPGTPPGKHTFPMRNTVMSGYGRASVIVEAGETSGTRIQGRVAVKHGRPVVLTEWVATSTQWGAALAQQPGVYVAASATEAAERAITLSEPQRERVDALLSEILAR